MEIVLIFWLLCGVVCYFIMKSKGYPNDTCLAHGVGGALLGVIWLIVVLCKKNCDEKSYSSQLSDMELLEKLMDLKERGAITEAEFEEKKREILKYQGVERTQEEQKRQEAERKQKEARIEAYWAEHEDTKKALLEQREKVRAKLYRLKGEDRDSVLKLLRSIDDELTRDR